MVKRNNKFKSMKRLILLVLLLAVTGVSCLAYCSKGKSSNTVVKTGIDVLQEDGFKQIKGKKVGLVTNPSGVNKDLISTVDILHQAEGVELVALYGPEHGVRGDIHGGDFVDEGDVDKKTGVKIFSLYGKTMKPTAEMLQGLDAIIYDIQDIGCRSYTFISTMGKVMEAAAEHGVEVIILDRPNPLGGNRIEGSLVREGFYSFVSQFEIPYLYGLTCGELAVMLNEEGLIKNKEGKALKCKLTVIEMKGWKREMLFEETGLPWVLPSPHIPHPASSYFYPVTGILGELMTYSIGVGYTLPFEMVAFNGLDAELLASELNALKLSGVVFRPINVKPFYSIGKGENYEGVQIYLTDMKSVQLTDIQFYIMETIARLYPEKAIFKLAPESRYRSFDIVTGSDYYRKTFSVNHKFSDIKEKWYADVDSFRERSKRYYLYK